MRRFWQMMYVRGMAAASVFCSSLTAARICGISNSCTCKIVFQYEQEDSGTRNKLARGLLMSLHQPDYIYEWSCKALENLLLMR